ncbi:5-bromo-4-chloroindolyl phosphate hydrolysis family protein [Pseudooceanicola algae]|uniref:5-bromo-4-chloroindolyl phosphate hydrolysis protein n=1 Tax=Pseudooceanicola algae TaxID=1537215 RepID=A0A418SH61_9RHOB|nr:5-bromo-4-chloroindolyl phosphate hydrolysis family protein [Pseudooceanicola algae]QPM90391.1 hypothetical protein PSAL_016290 [Pseudooceanicola algae]
MSAETRTSRLANRLGLPRSGSARVRPAGARINLLYLPAVLSALSALWLPPAELAYGLGAALLWGGAARLTSEGLLAEQAFRSRRRARRPALPRKLIASLALGCGTMMATLAHGATPGGALILGLITGALHLAAFGLDPLHDRIPEGDPDFAHDRVLRVVERAETELAAMRDAIATLKDRALNERLQDFEGSARHLLLLVEEDPRDLGQARRLLGVYLTGARAASERFAEVYAHRQSPADRAEYEALLDDLQGNFAARAEKMLQEDAMDMTIEIEVLRDRLRREGITSQPERTE